jgi:hypothetical protein
VIALSPTGVLRQLAAEIPEHLHANMIVIGSLAAAYHFFRDDPERGVRTKDVDCLLTPRIEAEDTGASMTRALLGSDWTIRTDDGFGTPRATPQPADRLSAIRLVPPGNKLWFLELLTVPAPDERGKTWLPVLTDDGFFGLPAFEYLGLAAHDPLPTDSDIRYGRPELMALANLLAHPTAGGENMSARYGDREITRSAKDIGRVLAIARLTELDEIRDWSARWQSALQAGFPDRWRPLAAAAGDGLKALVASEAAFEQAHHTCVYSLLAGQQVTIDQLRATASRVIQFALEPLARAALAA